MERLLVRRTDNGRGHLGTYASRRSAVRGDADGAPLQSTTPSSLVERWTGRWDKKLDTASNLVEMGARPYDPLLGRFLAIDPIDGGSLNSYDYAGQDPANSYDLTGTVNIKDPGGGAGGGPGAAGGSGKPRTYHKKFKSKKEAREASQRASAPRQKPDHEPHDRYVPRYHAKDAKGKRKTDPSTHYKYPPFRSGRRSGR